MDEMLSVVRWKVEGPPNSLGAFGSPFFRAVGHNWRIVYLPVWRTDNDEDVRFASLFLYLGTTPAAAAAEGVTVDFELSLATVEGEGLPVDVEKKIWPQPFKFSTSERFAGWRSFVPTSAVDAAVAKNGHIVVVARIEDAKMKYPQQRLPSITRDLSNLLQSKVACDVEFTVGGEAFAAHKLVLAARSPVFKAQFYGSLADSGFKDATITKMRPVVFEALLHFAYNDKMLDGPADGECSVYSSVTLQEILAAADYYAMEPLKEMCESKLCKRIVVHTVVSLLICAMRYNCSRLKSLCLQFIVDATNAADVMVSDDYMQMWRHPEVADEIRKFKKQRSE